MSDDPEYNYNHNGLGRMVAGLAAKVDAFQSNWQEQDRRAAEGRKFLYDRIEGFATNVQALAHKLESIDKDVSEMKPAVQDWVASKNRAEGAAWSAKFLWVLAGGVVVGVGWLFDHFLAIVPHN